MGIEKIAAKAATTLSKAAAKTTSSASKIAPELIENGGKKLAGSLDGLAANAMAGIKLKNLQDSSLSKEQMQLLVNAINKQSKKAVESGQVIKLSEIEKLLNK